MEQNALEKLKNIGVEKIKGTTNIDTGKIEDILEKRFDRIDFVRARGFVHIIEKEYQVDLSFWLDEYVQYQVQNGGDKRTQENRKFDNLSKASNLKVWLGCLLLVVFGGGVLYWISLQNSRVAENKVVQEENKIQKVEQSIYSANESVIQESEKKEESLAIDDNSTVAIQTEVEKKNVFEYGKEVFPKLEYNEENILFLTSDTPLWVGIINLDTKKRVAKIKKEFEIPLDKQLLINIARGGFVAVVDDNEKRFNSSKPIYLIHTIQGGLRQISKEEFLALNGGVEW